VPVLNYGFCLGLSNTCPQACVMRRTLVSRGQVSNKPKQEPTFAPW
jgi:hypothetical protein